MPVQVDRGGLLLGEQPLPLLSGEAHYWRIDPADWPAVLDGIASLGFTAVSTYVPWSRHEDAGGALRFDGGLDVERFLALAAQRGLHAVVRLGPNCGAELEDAGWPRRILEDPACQARRPGGGRYLLPTATGHAFMPSYAARSTLAAVTAWYDEVVPRLAPLQWPDGPIVAAQVDNEMGYHFQSHAFALDYHPDAIEQWHEFLSERHGEIGRLNAAYGTAYPAFGAVPAPGDGREQPLARRLDWVRFREHHLRRSLATLADLVRVRGMDRVPLLHNDFPRTTTPLDQGALERSGAVDVAGGDIYAPKEGGRYVRDFARHLDTSTRLAYLAEMGVGWLTLPWLLPMAVTPLDVEHNLWRALSGGVRAANVFMLVERDRWYASPLSVQGEPRPEYAGLFRRMLALLHDLDWGTLRRDRRVLLLENRDEDRLVAAGALLGDVVPAFSQLLPLDRRLFDDPSDRGSRLAAWTRAAASALDAAGVDTDRASTSALPDLTDYDVVLLPHVDAIDPPVLQQLCAAADADAGVTVLAGPVEVPGLTALPQPDAASLARWLPRPEFRRDDALLDLTNFTGAGREVLVAVNGGSAALTAHVHTDGPVRLIGAWRPEELADDDGSVIMELPAWGVQVFTVTRGATS